MGLKPLLTIKGYQDEPGKGVRSVYFSPDGKVLATAGGFHIRLWDVKTGKLLRETTIQYDSAGKLQDGGVACHGFLNGGKLLACSCGPTLQIHWLDVETLKIKNTLPKSDPRENPCWGAACPTGATFAMHDRKGLLTVWNADTGKQKWQHDFQTYAQRSMTFSPDGTRLTVMEPQGDSIQVFEVANGKEMFSRRGVRWTERHTGGLRPVFSPDGHSLLIGITHAQELCLLEARAKGASRMLTWPKPPPTDPCKKKDRSSLSYPSVYAFSPDGKSALAACADESLRFCEVATGELYAEVEQAATTLAFSPDGRILATGDASLAEIHLWDWPGSLRGQEAALSAEAAAKAWADLQSREAKVGRTALATLLGDPKSAVEQAKNLRPVAAPAPKELDGLVKDLSSDTFAVRAKAERRLAELGRAAVGRLREAIAKPETKEAEGRIKDLLEQAETLTKEDLQVVRGVEILERLGTDDARKVLKELAAGAPGALVTTQANDALERLK